MQWTWFVACEMQFYCLVPALAYCYYHRRKLFWVIACALWLSCGLVSLIVILRNDFTASYFTYKDEYWQVFYEKPWARFPAYLLGLVLGCSYFTYKHEQDMRPGRKTQAFFEAEFGYVERAPEKNIFVLGMHAIKLKSIAALASVAIGIILQFSMVHILVMINMKAENDLSQFWNLVYLLIQRPLFCAGSALLTFPLVL